MTENKNNQQHEGENRCIQLIRCVTATEQDQKCLQDKPKLEINTEALTIIAEKFQQPISIVVYVGNLGAGKSKLATLTVETLRTTQSSVPSQPFRSGAGLRGVTHGVWMWCEPLNHRDENQSGSILVLDCEGMLDFDENTAANLYLFCMIMSTAFAVVLRPARVDHLQLDRLYHALRRFKDMRIPYVLPNLWLVAMDMPVFVRNDEEGDIIISKDEWLKEALSITSNTPAKYKEESLKLKYDFINQMLPQCDAVNLGHLPSQLLDNSPKLDVYQILRSEQLKEYFESLQSFTKNLLSNGGKRLPGCYHSSLYIRPGELTALMSDLIDVLNDNKMPNADALINRYLLTRFKQEIINQQMAEFKEALLLYVENLLQAAIEKKTRSPATPIQKNNIEEQTKTEQHRLILKYFGVMICRGRCEIYGLDSASADDYSDINEQNSAILDLPKPAQEYLNDIKIQMNEYKEPELLINQMHFNSIIEDLKRQEQEQARLLHEIKKTIESKRDLVHREKRINFSLKNAKSVRVGLAPCKSCKREGGATNVVHPKKYCPSGRKGNFYYYNRENERMVCDACRSVEKIAEQWVECSRCGDSRKVTRIYTYEEANMPHNMQ